MASRRNPIIEPPEGVRITKLQRGSEETGWTANVSLNGVTVPVQQKPHWSTRHVRGQRFRSVLTPVAAALGGAVATAKRVEARRSESEAA